MDTLGEDANESGWFWVDFVVVVAVPFLAVVVTVLVDNLTWSSSSSSSASVSVNFDWSRLVSLLLISTSE